MTLCHRAQTRARWRLGTAGDRASCHGAVTTAATGAVLGVQVACAELAAPMAAAAVAVVPAQALVAEGLQVALAAEARDWRAMTVS